MFPVDDHWLQGFHVGPRVDNLLFCDAFSVGGGEYGPWLDATIRRSGSFGWIMKDHLKQDSCMYLFAWRRVT